MIEKNLKDVIQAANSQREHWEIIKRWRWPHWKTTMEQEEMLTVILQREQSFEPFGWGSVTTTSRTLVSAIRLAALFEQRNDELNSNKDEPSSYENLTTNRKLYLQNTFQYQLEAIMNASEYSSSISTAAEAMLAVIDESCAFPVICAYCASLLPPFDDTHDDVMIRYSSRIMAGDQYLDDGMSRNRSTARAYSSFLLARYRKDRRNLLKFCGGTCRN